MITNVLSWIFYTERKNIEQNIDYLSNVVVNIPFQDLHRILPKNKSLFEQEQKTQSKFKYIH